MRIVKSTDTVYAEAAEGRQGLGSSGRAMVIPGNLSQGDSFSLSAPSVSSKVLSRAC